MIRVGPDISISEENIRWEFIRAGGPGGQKVNKTSSAVQLRFDLAGSALAEQIKQRLRRLAGGRVSEQGVLVIDARRYRSQARNRQDALDRLIELIRRAAEQPKRRRPSRPTPASKQRRLQAKQRRAGIKRLRKLPPEE